MQNSAEIAVIGLGNAGLPLAAVIADCGIAVMGVDINEGRCLAINRGDNPIAEEAGLEEPTAGDGAYPAREHHSTCNPARWGMQASGEIARPRRHDVQGNQ